MVISHSVTKNKQTNKKTFTVGTCEEDFAIQTNAVFSRCEDFVDQKIVEVLVTDIKLSTFYSA